MASEHPDHEIAPRHAANIPAIRTIVVIAALPAIVTLAIVGWPVADARMYVFATPHPKGVTFDGFGFSTIAWLSINYALTAWLGYLLIASVFEGTSLSMPVRITAAFLPGYLGVVALARVFSLISGGGPMYAATCAAIIALACHRRRRTVAGVNVETGRRSSTSVGPPRQDWRTWLFIAGSVVFVAAVLLLQIFQNEFHWVGHGTQQYAIQIERWGDRGLFRPFPIIRQHYDELMYHYAIGWPFIGGFDPILPWWTTLALVKLSTWAAIFASFRILRVPHWAAIAYSTFFMLGTYFPPGTQYYLMYDSGNPLALCVHSGRIAGVVFVLLLIADECRSDRAGRIDRLSLGILTLGLTATSLSNSLWLLAVIAVLVMRPRCSSAPSDRSSRHEAFVGSGCVLSAIVICPVLYSLPFHEPYFLVRLALATAPFAVWGCILLARFLREIRGDQVRSEAWKQHVRRLVVPVGGATLVGLILLGNLYAGGARNGFGTLLRLVLGSVGLSLDEERLNGGMAAGNWRDLGDHRELDIYPETYAQNGAMFVAYYGMLLAMILLADRWVMARVRDDRRLAAGIVVQHRLFAFAVVALPVVFFFIDFIGMGERAGIKLRFLEIPVYLITFVFCAFASRFADRPMRWLVAGTMVVYSIMPFIGTDRPRQIQANLDLFFDLLRN